MRTPAGIFMPNDNMQNYCKPALSIDQQLDLLISRGLTIPDQDKARHYLNYIGYHRLSGYFLTFQQSDPGVKPHSFKNDVAQMVTESNKVRLRCSAHNITVKRDCAKARSPLPLR
jgi:abortive infection bacteriophage resistance protein